MRGRHEAGPVDPRAVGLVRSRGSGIGRPRWRREAERHVGRHLDGGDAHLAVALRPVAVARR